MESLSSKLKMRLVRSPGDGSGMVFQRGTEGLILVTQEQALRKNSETAQIRRLRHCFVGCAGTPLKQSGILPVGGGSLPKENTGSATTRWLYGSTGSCVESMSQSVPSNGTTKSTKSRTVHSNKAPGDQYLVEFCLDHKRLICSSTEQNYSNSSV